MAAFLILNSQASCCLINVPLNDMPIQPAVHLHATFHVHLVTYLQQTQIAAFQRFSHSCYNISIILDAYHRQTHTIMCHALINTQLCRKWAAKGEMHIILIVLDSNHTCHCFYNSREHNFPFYNVVFFCKAKVGQKTLVDKYDMEKYAKNKPNLCKEV